MTESPSSSPSSVELPNTGLESVLGFEYLERRGDRVVLTWTITPDQHQPFGIVHGGVYCAAVESAASVGAYLWLEENGKGSTGSTGSSVVGVSNTTNFLRATSSGQMTATGLPIHRGRSQQLWRVEVRDEQDRLVAVGEVRLQNLSRPA